MSLSTPFAKKPNAVAAILVGGLIAGILDITDAFVFFGLRGASPVRILQSIASGLLGASAFSGGWKTAALGLFLHFTIATGAATGYYVASRQLPVLIRQAALCGLIYGGLWYVFMNYVVLPLSHVAKRTAPTPTVSLINGVAAIVFCVGLPIGLVVRRYSR